MEKIALRPATARSTTTSATANATRSSRSTPTAASPAARRYPPPKAAAVNPTSPPRLHAMGVDVMLAGNMGDGAKNVLQRNGIAVIRGCHGPVEGGRRGLSGRPDRRFGRRLRTPSRRRLPRTPRDDRLAPRRMTETGADGTIRNPSAAIFSRGRRYFSVKAAFWKILRIFASPRVPTARRSLAAPG